MDLTHFNATIRPLVYQWVGCGIDFFRPSASFSDIGTFKSLAASIGAMKSGEILAITIKNQNQWLIELTKKYSLNPFFFWGGDI